MSIYQQPPLEGPRQLGSPWGPERERKKWSSRFSKRKLLIGVGVYLLLNLAYFLLSILTPYSFVPELRLLIWVLFSLFCLGFGFFLVIGLGLLIIKFVRQEPKRKILYALLGLLAYLPFAGVVLTAMLVFGVMAFVITLVESDWEAHPEYGTVYYERVSDGTILNRGSYCRSMEQVWGPITRKSAEDALCKYRGERADTYSDPGYLPESYPSETDLTEEPTGSSQVEDGVTWTKE